MSGKTVVPRVMLVSPKYSSEVIDESHNAKEWADDNESYAPEHHVQIACKLGSRGSLLPWVFNALLAEALNKRDDGEIDFIAMLHSDISAAPGWCNELYKRMTERGDMMISAVVPMKDHDRSKTSTAIGVRDQPFNFRRFIRTSDRPGMPVTFGTGDVAEANDEVLLVNTGLWLADLRWEGWDSFCFDFLNEIRPNPETGRRQAWVASEDWLLSHYLDKHGAPYSATWLRLKHTGTDYWDSFELPPIYPTFAPNVSQKAEAQ